MSYINIESKTAILVAELDSGRLVNYDGCMKEESGKGVYSFYDPEKWVCIGTGVCHSCNGFPSNSITRYHFYIKKF